MKTHNNLFEKIVSFENMLSAAKKARKGKKKTKERCVFQFGLENELSAIIKELKEKSYKPGKYRTFDIYEPKKRMISAAPYRDRVVHHALCNVIEPLFEAGFIFDSYANRKGKGTHKAINRYQHFAKKYEFVLKCDIKKYFPSIDHEILKSKFIKKIKCRDTLNLMNKILDNSNEQEKVDSVFGEGTLFFKTQRRKGIPMGNLTSQFFGNLFLNSFDHYVKEKLSVEGYIRYVDDFVLFGNNKKEMAEKRNQIVEYLKTHRLKLNENKSIIYRTDSGVEFLGHKAFPYFKLLKKQNIQRFKRNIKKLQKMYWEHKIGFKEIMPKIMAWRGHAKFSNTYNLLTMVFEQHPFVRGGINS